MTDDSRPVDPLLDRKLHHSARVARCGDRLHRLLEIRAPDWLIQNDIRMIADDLNDLWILIADSPACIAREAAKKPTRKKIPKADE